MSDYFKIDDVDVVVGPHDAYIDYKGSRYYKDGVLYGHAIDQPEVMGESSMPTLWSETVVRYFKKPVEVEAIQLTSDNVDKIAEWCDGDALVDEIGIIINTLEGEMRAYEHDYIIRGIKGEFYPCKPDIFMATYEIV